MTPRQAIAFVRRHGIVLEAATGAVPSLAQAIAGEPIRGSWWAHPAGQEIFRLTRVVRECSDILVCRLVAGRITYVHRRLWPALVRAVECFPAGRLARVQETHAASGRHVATEVVFPAWVPDEVSREASKLSVDQALFDLGAWTGDQETSAT